MRHNRIVYGFACCVAIAVAHGAMADLIEFEFSGIVTSSEPTGNPPGPSSGVNVGDTFSGHFRFDTNALLTEISDFFATSGTVVVDFEVRFFSAGTGGLISSWDFSNDGDPIGTPGSDFFSIRNDHPAAEFPDGIELEDREVLNGQDVIYQTRFDDTTGSVFESLEIPETLDLGDFDFNHFQIQSLTDSWIVRGEITELVLIPIPPAAWIGSLGFVAVIVMRRKIL